MSAEECSYNMLHLDSSSQQNLRISLSPCLHHEEHLPPHGPRRR